MTKPIQIQVSKQDFRKVRQVELEEQPLLEDEVRVAIDKFAVTANNVSYCLGGEDLYWSFYPADEQWGVVPVWGVGTVVESNNADAPVGTRLHGFYPMAGATVLRLQKKNDEQFVETSKHREALPGLYSEYGNVTNNPKEMMRFEDASCLFVILLTSYVVSDYCVANNYFDAEQIVVSSVSSKTGFGLARLLKDDPACKAEIIGLTSMGNREFVEKLDCCDRLLCYGDEQQIANGKKTAYIDFAASSDLLTSLHKHFGDNLVESCLVGFTDWEGMEGPGVFPESLPGAKPHFFFHPAHQEMRDKEWGEGELHRRGMRAVFKLIAEHTHHWDIEWVEGGEALVEKWQALLDNKIPGRLGLMVKLGE